MKLSTVDCRFSARGAISELVSGAGDKDQTEDDEIVSLHKSAYSDDERRDHGQRSVAEHVVKDRLEFWDNEHEQKSHDRDRHCHDDERVDHRSGDFVFNLGRLFLKLREPGKNELEHTADFASFHHIDIKIVKDERILRETFRKRAAALDRLSELVDRVFQDRITFLFGENVEAAQKWQARIDQGCELTRENHQDFRLNFSALKKNDAFSFFARLGDARCFGRAFGRFAIAPAAFSFLVNIGRKKSGLTQLADGFVRRGGFDQSGRFLSARIERYVSETRHDDINVRRTLRCISIPLRWWYRRQKYCAIHPAAVSPFPARPLFV